MELFFNKLDINFLIDIFTKFKNIEKIKIYYDLNEKSNNKLYYLNNEEINIINEIGINEYCYEYKEIIKDELPYYENNKLFINNMKINYLIDSLIISSIFNFDIILPNFNINECKKLDIISNLIYNKLVIIDDTIYFSNFIKIIINNKTYSTLLNFEYKNYLNNFLIDNLPKLILFIIIKNEHFIKKSNKIKDLSNLNLFNTKKMDKIISKLFIKVKYKIIIKKYYFLINLLYNVKDKALLLGYLSRRYNEDENEIYEYCINVYNNFVEKDKIIIDEIKKLKILTKEFINEKMKNISIINTKFKNNEDIISIIDYQDGFILLCKFLYENKLFNSADLNNDLLIKIFDANICEIRANKLIGLSSDGNNNNQKFKTKYELYKEKYNQLKYLIKLVDEKYNTVVE
jgi:hypothetical protein